MLLFLRSSLFLTSGNDSIGLFLVQSDLMDGLKLGRKDFLICDFIWCGRAAHCHFEKWGTRASECLPGQVERLHDVFWMWRKPF